MAELTETTQHLHLLHEQITLLQLKPSEQGRSRTLATLSRLQATWSQSRLFTALGYLWIDEMERFNADLSAMKSQIVCYHKLLSVWKEYLNTEDA